MTWNEDDWQRLGDLLRASRRSAGYPTKEGFADAVGISSKTYGDIEAGRLGKRTSFSFDTIAQIEDVLGWEVGASRKVLDGKDVDPRTGIAKPEYALEEPSFSESPKDENDYSTFAWLDERVERLEARLLKVERALRTNNAQNGDESHGTQATPQKTDAPELPRETAVEVEGAIPPRATPDPS
jgi:DNA-binding XRE family transcriptional regulator